MGHFQRPGDLLLYGLLLSRGLGLYWVCGHLQRSTYWVLDNWIERWRASPTLSVRVIGKWWLGTGFEIHFATVKYVC